MGSLPSFPQPNHPAVLAQGRDGNLYGTTANGGTSGAGTVFKVTPSGALTTIHNFSGSDGDLPYGGLTLGPSDRLHAIAMEQKLSVSYHFTVRTGCAVDMLSTTNAVENALATSIAPNAGVTVDDTQPFPVSGWLEVKWVSPPLVDSPAR
jgi:uncharacterized repeat protein (TIGR03803 family)